MTLTIIAAIAFCVGSVFDIRSTQAAMKFPGAYEFWPLYRWPPWKRGKFQLWMYLAGMAIALAIAITQERFVELFLFAGLRLFAGLYWNPKQIAKAQKAQAVKAAVRVV